VITTAGVAGWRVFFMDPSRRWPAFADPLAQRFAERLPELLGRHGRVADQPFLLGLDGLPDRRVNGFFASHRMLARDRDTWRKYAYALGLWLNFLTSRGVGWSRLCQRMWRRSSGTVNLLKLSGGTGMVGSGGSVCVACVRPLWPCR
jgi:hypothetical protein